MLNKKHKNIFVRLLLVLLCTCSSTPEVKTAAAEVMKAAEDLSRLASGMGVVTRIRNLSEYPADVGFKEIVHDQVPNNTTGRFKRADGAYLTCRKVEDKPVVAFEKVDAKDAATLWYFSRIKDEVLHDWIGIWHMNADGQYLGVDPETGRLTFATKEFRKDSKAIHWEVVGKNIGGFLFRNRQTGGILHQRTQEIEVLKAGEEDREETLTAQDTFIIGHGQTLRIGAWDWKNTDGRFSLVDSEGKYVSFANGWWQNTGRTDDPSAPSTVIHTVKSWDGNYRGKFDNGMRVHLYNVTQNKLLVAHQNGLFMSSPNWRDWERFIVKNTNWATPRSSISYGNPVVIHTWHNNQMMAIHENKNHYQQIPNFDFKRCVFFVMPLNLVDINYPANVYRVGADKNSTTMLKGFLEHIAIRSGNEAYGVSHTRFLYRWDGDKWTKVSTNFRPRRVSISGSGDVCSVDTENRLWLKNDDGWTLFAEKVVFAGIRSKAEIWCITQDGNIVRDNGTNKENFPLPTGEARWLSITDNGALWAIAKKDNAVWRYNFKTKAWLQIPGGGFRISARSETDAWLIGMDGKVYRYENNDWVQTSMYAADIALASAVTVKKIPGAREKKVTTFITTHDEKNKAFDGDPTAQLEIEIEKLGMGGAIGPRESIDFAGIPASQYPRVKGFAVDRIDDFDPAAILSLNPLISKGAAWLESALKTPDVGGTSFMVRVRDAGDAQIVFGQEMSNSFAYKVILGGWNNSKSAIVKREYVKGTPIDTVVYELSVDQYPIARVQSGQFVPYWASIDNGLIMAGFGEFGSNVFLAWRDPNPVRGVTRIGFSSHKTPVQFNNIKITPPARFSTVPRVYTKSQQKISPAAGGDISWADTPFRMHDRGCIQFTLQGNSATAVILARKKNSKASHYAIIFGDDNNSSITIKKWHTGQRRYNERARIKLDPLPHLKLESKKRKSFWVSFYFGQIVIGTGDMGEDPLYVFQDLAAIDNIDSFGFANHANATGSEKKTAPIVAGLQMGSPLVLRATLEETSYDKGSGPMPFGGGLTIILPFDFEFSQEDQVVKLTDYVLNSSYYLGATPQQGAIYAFQVTIDATGFLKLDWTKAPENQKQLEIQKAVMKVKNEAELASIEAARLRSQGAIDQALKAAAGQRDRDKAAALTTGGQSLVQAGGSLAGMAAGAGPLAPVVAGVGIGIAAGGVALIAASTAIGALSADKDFEGAELKLVKERQAAMLESNAAKNTALAEGAANLATVGARNHDSYVFLDTPNSRQEMGKVDTSDAAKRNRAEAAAKLDQATQIRPTKLEDMIKLSLLYKDFVMLANQSAVLSGDQTIKQRFLGGADNLLRAYLSEVESKGEIGLQLHQDMLIFLLNAYNNPYLMDELKSDEAKMKDSWYWLVTIFGRQLIEANESRSISLDRFYGEYCWLEDGEGSQFVFTTPGTGMVSFEARGTDIFVCLAAEKARVRNSEVELYEVCFGGWDNTKTALRLKSLDRYVAVVTKKENLNAMADQTTFKKYWVSCVDGVINIGCGDPGKGTVLTWKDPYPNTKVRVVGLSSWNSRVDFKNIKVGDSIEGIIEAEKAAATVDESATLAQNIAKLEEVNAVFDAIEEAERDKTGNKLTPDEIDQLEVIGVDTAAAAFNQRYDGTAEDRLKLQELFEKLYEDASDDDHIEILETMLGVLEKERAKATETTSPKK